MTRPPLILTIVMIGMWLLLNDSLAPGQIVLGTVIAISMVLVFRNVRPLQPRVRRPLAAIGLFFRVLIDITRSNIAVAGIILGLTGSRTVRSGLLAVPLELRDPHGLAVLAAIVTSTPGTVWVDFKPEGGTLTLHVLDLKDEEGWIRTIKERYERALMEIFE